MSGEIWTGIIAGILGAVIGIAIYRRCQPRISDFDAWQRGYSAGMRDAYLSEVRFVGEENCQGTERGLERASPPDRRQGFHASTTTVPNERTMADTSKGITSLPTVPTNR